MTQKSISLSVRLSPEDASALATLDIPEASTPSDKIRTLIRRAKDGEALNNDPSAHLKSAENVMTHLLSLIQQAEQEKKQHSELVSYFLQWLSNTTAHFRLILSDLEPPFSDKHLNELEQEIAARQFLLLENTLRLAVTGKSPCYDPNLIVANSKTTCDLAALVAKHIQKHEENHG